MGELWRWASGSTFRSRWRVGGISRVHPLEIQQSQRGFGRRDRACEGSVPLDSASLWIGARGVDTAGVKAMHSIELHRLVLGTALRFESAVSNKQLVQALNPYRLLPKRS